jgi:hypothetical protein
MFTGFFQVKTLETLDTLIIVLADLLQITAA